jgi:hypothetical protein
MTDEEPMHDLQLQRQYLSDFMSGRDADPGPWMQLDHDTREDNYRYLYGLFCACIDSALGDHSSDEQIAIFVDSIVEDNEDLDPPRALKYFIYAMVNGAFRDEVFGLRAHVDVSMEIMMLVIDTVARNHDRTEAFTQAMLDEAEKNYRMLIEPPAAEQADDE